MQDTGSRYPDVYWRRFDEIFTLALIRSSARYEIGIALLFSAGPGKVQIDTVVL